MNISQKSATILFDLDGTLVDSVPDMLTAMNRSLVELGRPAVSASALRGWVGDGVATLIRRALIATGGLSDDLVQTMQAAYLRNYDGHTADESRPYPEVENVLHQLSAEGYRLAVCTNKPTSLSLQMLESLGLRALFSAVVGGDAVPQRKPDPGHLLVALAAAGGDRDHVVMVGDSINDVEAARAAGIPVVAVSFGYSRRPPAELGADLLIDHFSVLPDAVRRFF
ncbi:MAG TPA: phosphoglycolate phosphatase [Rhodospirillaceae bacterium]|nr:phosphoglycolate phosphatase [Rhodospirillaceae bacterium]